jgi:5-methyltetrahydropteroyltriglutamate--homocysteine methyltransferase
VARIETTHVGSMPRGEILTPLLRARDAGELYDVEAFDRLVSDAVEDAVTKQVECGVDTVSDGEIGKIGYSTYMIERLSGFGGHVDRKPAADLAAHPALTKKLSAMMGSQDFVRASCIAPVKLVTLDPLWEDIRRFKAALARHGDGVKSFMNAASPGLISAFQLNRYYPTQDAYLADLSAAMQPEYEAIVDQGFLLQLDCPDLAMSRHTGFQDLSDDEFLNVAEANVEALNAATANIPPEKMRMHICWGNYEGPHDHDIPLERVIDIILKARPATILFEAANPRHEHEWTVWADAKIPDEKKLAPGLIDTCSNYVEHPELIAQRIERFAAIVGVERVIASTDCGFGTFAGYGKIDPDVTWKKLRALRHGADIAAARI